MRALRRHVARVRMAIGVTLAVALLVTMAPIGAAPARAEVPTPPPGSSVITVKTGGDRTGANDNTYLAGVQLALYASASATDPIAQPWATCTSDADGDCNFIVPDTAAGGANNGAQYYVRQPDGGVPPGWYTNPQLRTGGTGATPSNPTTYQFQTPAMAAGQTFRSSQPGANFMFSTNNNLATQSGGIWQNSRNNPTLTDSCGLDVALVMDTSSSMQGQMDNQRAAADSFVNALVGTPSRVATFSFSNGSPGASATPNHPELRPVSTQAGANVVKNEYAGWQANGGTNWDQGFNAVAQAAPHYDLVIFLTDGNPTYWGNPYAGAGTTNTLRSVEGGIFSANAVKAENSRVIAFGVGSGVTDSATALNLRSISGPVAYQPGVTPPGSADYYQTANFEQAGADLHALALQLCYGSVSVVKQIVPPDNTGEDVSGSTNAGAGWTFTASSSTGTGLPVSQTTTDDGTGAVTFQPGFPPGADYIDLTVNEDQHPNYTLVTQGGQNAVCTNLATGERMDVQNTTGPNGPGFTLPEEPANDAISCIMYNRPPQTADITVHKRWNIDGEEMDNGDQPDGFSSQLMLSGPGDAGASEQPWGETRTGYIRNETATFDENNVQVPDPTCRPVQSRVTSANGDPADDPLPYDATLSQEHNSYTVTNTTTCDSLLTLVKKVNGGSAQPSDWTLSADGPTPISGHSGEHDVTNAFVDPGTYTLGEDDGPGGYDASDWSCVNHDDLPVDVAGGQVELPKGDAVTCTIENTHRPVGGWTVRKTSNPPSGTRVAGGHVITYTLTARPDHEYADEVRITDDLRRVLNSSTFVPGSLRPTAGHAALSGSRLTWSIPRLTGEETLTYQVRVNDHTDGRLIDNAVRPGPRGECVVACETEHTTPGHPGGDLPFTGSALGLLSGLAAALIAAGLAAIWWTRRRRTA